MHMHSNHSLIQYNGILLSIIQTYNSILAQIATEGTGCEGDWIDHEGVIKRANMLGLKVDSIAMDRCTNYDIDSGHQFITQCIDWWGSNRGGFSTNTEYYHYDYDGNKCRYRRTYGNDNLKRSGHIFSLNKDDNCSPYLNVSF